MPVCEAPPAIYATMPRSPDVFVYWTKDIATSQRVCAYFKADHSRACYVPGVRIIVVPRGLAPADETSCLDHEYAHDNGWRHPAPYSVMGHYR